MTFAICAISRCLSLSGRAHVAHMFVRGVYVWFLPAVYRNPFFSAAFCIHAVLTKFHNFSVPAQWKWPFRQPKLCSRL